MDLCCRDGGSAAVVDGHVAAADVSFTRSLPDCSPSHWHESNHIGLPGQGARLHFPET